MHQPCRIRMRFAIFALLVKAANGQPRYGGVKGVAVPVAGVYEEGVVSFTGDFVWHSGEEIVHQCAGKSDCFKVIAATIAGNHCDPHL